MNKICTFCIMDTSDPNITFNSRGECNHCTTARTELARKVGWEYYGRKHGESKFTKFFQNYYLPTKFGYDKRRAHLSSLIVSGEITREQALEKLKEPLYDPVELKADKAVILDRLGYTEAEWDRIMAIPTKTYQDYPHWDNCLQKLQTVKRYLKKLKMLS